MIARAPLTMSIIEIELFIIKKSNWIDKHLSIVSKNNNKSYNNGDLFLYLGTEYSLIIENCELIFNGNNFIGRGNKQEFLSLYKKHFIQIINKRLPQIAKDNNFNYNTVRIKVQKTLWGSCSSKNNLNFNYLLMIMPLSVIDSVIIHELCHTIHKNHSANFWNLVYKIMPTYKIHQQYLKQCIIYL